MLNATVLSYDRARGTGWAIPDDGTNDVFIHRKSLPAERKYLNEGDRISYEMGEHNGRSCAKNVRFIGRVIARPVAADKAARP